MLVHTVLKSNQIAQHVIADGKAKQNGGMTKKQKLKPPSPSLTLTSVFPLTLSGTLKLTK